MLRVHFLLFCAQFKWTNWTGIIQCVIRKTEWKSVQMLRADQTKSIKINQTNWTPVATKSYTIQIDRHSENCLKQFKFWVIWCDVPPSQSSKTHRIDPHRAVIHSSVIVQVWHSAEVGDYLLPQRIDLLKKIFSLIISTHGGGTHQWNLTCKWYGVFGRYNVIIIIGIIIRHALPIAQIWFWPYYFKFYNNAYCATRKSLQQSTMLIGNPIAINVLVCIMAIVLSLTNDQATAARCSRIPEGFGAKRTVSPGNFRIRLSDDSGLYKPGKAYTG